jgi:hypothetical protein
MTTLTFAGSRPSTGIRTTSTDRRPPCTPDSIIAAPASTVLARPAI